MNAPLPNSEAQAVRDDVHAVEVARTPLRRAMWMVAGFICVGIGLIGVVLPGLPTTPFMLLAAACFYRSSQRFYDWLIRNRMFGHYVRDFREGRGIPKRIKQIAISMMAVFVTYAVGWGIPSHMFWARVITAVAGVAGTAYILIQPTNPTPTQRAAKSETRKRL